MPGCLYRLKIPKLRIHRLQRLMGQGRSGYLMKRVCRGQNNVQSQMGGLYQMGIWKF